MLYQQINFNDKELSKTLLTEIFYTLISLGEYNRPHVPFPYKFEDQE